MCYILNAALFDRLKNEYHPVGISCTLYRESEEAFLFFEGRDENSPSTKYGLGKKWVYHADLHPVASKIYSTGEDVLELEHATSTTDGLEYIFVYTPVIADGEIRGLICETQLWSTVKDEINSKAGIIVFLNFVFLFIGNIILLVMLYFVAIKPLSDMQNSVSSYKESKDSGILKKEIGRITSAPNEIILLASDISDMVEEIDRYVKEVRTVTAEKERISAELSVAANIQASQLPRVFPPFPDRTELDIYASMDPAKEVGGDFYDYFFIDDDHITLVIADVSGKGVPAALFMMSSRMLINNYSLYNGTPAEILEAVNNRICENNMDNMFVTVWLGILELSTGKLTCCNAGHEDPVIKRANGKFEILKDKHGLFVGVMPGIKYKEYEIQLEKDDIVFVYTDGVPEATNSELKLFGAERMVEALNSAPDGILSELLQTVKSRVNEFVGAAPQFDDLTMLAIKYFGK